MVGTWLGTPQWELPLDRNLENLENILLLSSIHFRWLLSVHHQQCCRAFTIPNAFFAACRSNQNTLTSLPHRGFSRTLFKLSKACRSFIRASKSFDHPLYALRGLILLLVLSRCVNNRKDVRFGDGVHSTPAKKECWNWFYISPRGRLKMQKRQQWGPNQEFQVSFKKHTSNHKNLQPFHKLPLF